MRNWVPWPAPAVKRVRGCIFSAFLELLLLEGNIQVWTFKENGSLEELYDYPDLEVVDSQTQIVIIFLFSLTAALSLGGNITVIVALSVGKRCPIDLRAFLINLAVSDVTMAVFSIPFTYTMFLLGRWIFQPWFCPIVMMMQQVSVLSSVYTLTAIGIDRYRAIVHPLSKRTERSRHRPVILTIWIMSFLVSSFQLYVSRAESFKYDGQWQYECLEKWESELNGQYYTVFVFGVTFLVPLAILGFTYSAIACKLWRRSAPGIANPERERTMSTAKWKVFKMMLTVVILFAICWLPLQSFLMMFYFVPGFGSYPVDHHRRIYALSYFGCLWLANANSCVNPIIYSFMSENFRADVKEVLRRVFGRFFKTRKQENSVRSNSGRSILLHRHHLQASATSDTRVPLSSDIVMEIIEDNPSIATQLL